MMAWKFYKTAATILIASGFLWHGSSALAEPTPTGAKQDPSTQCLAEQTETRFRENMPATELATRIALQCSELFPEFSEQECKGQSIYVCDELRKVHNESLAAKFEIMRNYAFQLVMLYRD